MSEDEAALDATKHEVKRLRRTLESLPPSQEAQRGRISARLRDAEAEVHGLEASLEARRQEMPGQDYVSDTERRYLEKIVERYSSIAGVYSDLSIQGQAQRTTKRLTAAATRFIDLHHKVYDSLTHSLDSDGPRTFRVDTFNELFVSIAATNPRIALIGDPGSGKSTTLGRLAYEYAHRALAEGSGPIPIVLDLAAMASSETFAEALKEAQQEALDAKNITQRRAVVMIDGLNETSHDVVNQIVQWLYDSPNASTIVACRKIDYLDRTLPLRRIDILPLDVGQIYSFVGLFLQDSLDHERLFWGLAGAESESLWQWFRNTDANPTFENFWHGDIGLAYSYEIEKRRLSELQTAVKASGQMPGVLEIVSNPFLLYVAILGYLNNDDLPASRSDLLRDFVQIMVERSGWSGSGIYDQPYAIDSPMGGERGEYLLKELAFEITREGFSTGVQAGWLDTFLISRVGAEEAQDFLDGAKRSGVLDWRGTSPSVVRFRHQLLQEYFASLRLGERLAAGASPTEFWPSSCWWEVTPWDEVILFLAGTSKDASEIVRWLSPVNPSLAFRCATAPGVRCAEAVLDRLYKPTSHERCCPIARAQWGRLLNEKGDPRPGVLLRRDGTPDIKWIRVPSGRYTIGGDESLRELGLHLPETTVDVVHEYFIAMYPLTYAQFGAFVANGYSKDRYWTVEGLQWRGSQTHPRLWDDPQYSYPNHPVVGVTWYEAVAYTKWLTEVTFGTDARWWEISLPTDVEWEVACRYPNHRRYAWGAEYEPGIANIDETLQGHSVGPYFLRRTTAVGLYEAGRNALGAYDFCGNVWEWSLSKWDEPFQAPEEISLNGTEHRVVRGDSWYNSVQFAPAAAHDCLDPDFGVNDTGIRLVKRKLAREMSKES